MAAYKPTPYDQIHTSLTRLRGVCWMLIRCVGDLPVSERPALGDVPRCVEYISSSLSQIIVVMDQLDPDLASVSDHIIFAEAIADSLKVMLWSDAMEIHGSDEMMSGLVDAISGCIDAAYDVMNAPPADPSVATIAAAQPVTPTPPVVKVKARTKAGALEAV